MKTRRPSPAIVISVIALVMSMTGSAIAAKVLITKSSQVKTGSLNGTDIANGSINAGDLSKSAIASVAKTAAKSVTPATPAAAGGDSTAAVSVTRKAPTAATPKDKQINVATLTALAPGAYVISGKATVAPASASPDLLTQTLSANRTFNGHCVLDVPGGATDEATGQLAAQFAQTPVTLVTQSVRTLGAAGDVKLNCDAGIPFTVSDVSLIAVKVGSATSSGS